MGNCFGAQVRAETLFYSTGGNDPGAATSSKKSRNSIVGTSTKEGGREAWDANNGGLLSQPASTPAMSGSLRAFSYNDLKAATRNFRPNCLLGKGGSGCVFKGYIDEQTLMPTQPGQGIPIAIKKLNLDRPQEQYKEWLAKLHFLVTLDHRNLAKLLGSCAEGDHRLLVYEFMPRGSLENHLFQRNHHQTLSWVIRMKIAIDAARGLAFLHNAETPIIYKDFKTSNILLDSQFNAKLSAKPDVLLTKDGAARLSNRVIATGYGAPEYVAIGRLTVKSDVYSFGVVLLEILTGRRVVDGSRPDEEQNLVEWAGPFLSDKRKSLRIMDQNLKGRYPVAGAQKAARVVLHCVNEDAKKRPTMKQVVESLQRLLINAEELSTYGNDLSQDGPSLEAGHGVHAVQRDELWQCIDGFSPCGVGS